MEHDVQLPPDHLSEGQQLSGVLGVLSRHTSTPHRVFFCVWDGWCDLNHSPECSIGTDDRSYYTFAGGLDHTPPGWASLDAGELPALMWPADHSWIVTNDVDLHWAGIGCSAGAVQDLLALDLDVVRVDRDDEFPSFSGGAANRL
ncbi:hypothetical protein ACSDQ9_08045 [Aestuariimicrobium soli]|uniref:hypothetical protein n=1 Tax=Aestuariimicrobium soli TaxID=2035834 RepID=UPI003EBBE900